jgi:hypothetical protein
MITLDEEIRARIARAIDDLVPITVSYIDTRGRPHIAFYGSTHVDAPDRLAIWVRNPAGELPRTVGAHPHVAAIYGNIKDRVYITFEGKARVSDDPGDRNRVFGGMHAIEQKFDAERKGAAVLVDLERVTVLSAAKGRQVFE